MHLLATSNLFSISKCFCYNSIFSVEMQMCRLFVCYNNLYTLFLAYFFKVIEKSCKQKLKWNTSDFAFFMHQQFYFKYSYRLWAIVLYIYYSSISLYFNMIQYSSVHVHNCYALQFYVSELFIIFTKRTYCDFLQKH